MPSLEGSGRSLRSFIEFLDVTDIFNDKYKSQLFFHNEYLRQFIEGDMCLAD